MERIMGRVASALLSTFLLLLVSAGLGTLVFFQVKNFSEKWPDIKKEMEPKIEKVQEFLIESTPLSQEKVSNMTSKDAEKNPLVSSKGNVGKKFQGLAGGLSSFMGTFLLVFVYIYFILRYRQHFKNFILSLVNNDRVDKTKGIMSKSAKVVTQYLQGKLILIGILSVVYSIGLGISGVSNFILVSVIAAVLTIIPFIGNIIGFCMALAFGYLTTGEASTLIGITLTFVISQFLESYVLQPYVVGDKVDVHPLFVILAVILGNYIWGILGMVIAIPVMAIITVVALHVEPLKPLGILFGDHNFDRAKDADSDESD